MSEKERAESREREREEANERERKRVIRGEKGEKKREEQIQISDEPVCVFAYSVRSMARMPSVKTDTSCVSRASF